MISGPPTIAAKKYVVNLCVLKGIDTDHAFSFSFLVSGFLNALGTMKLSNVKFMTNFRIGFPHLHVRRVRNGRKERQGQGKKGSTMRSMIVMKMKMRVKCL